LTINDLARVVAIYVSGLSDFRYVKPEVPYDHMGATITDAVLQPGLNYETVVKPRVDAIFKKYPTAKTTSGFVKLLAETDPRTLLNWKDFEKPSRLVGVAEFFKKEQVENEKQLKIWLEKEPNLIKLDAVRGVGKKTIDYFKILCGIPTAAIDRHLLNFLRQAGVDVNTYEEAKEVIDKTAGLIGKDTALLDHSIWKYMSQKQKKFNNCSGTGR